MNIQINIGEGERSAPLREGAEQIVRNALERFGQRITRVELHLRDHNGPKAGVDRQCKIEVRLSGRDPITVDATAADAATALKDAASKAERAVDRLLDKERTNTRR